MSDRIAFGRYISLLGGYLCVVETGSRTKPPTRMKVGGLRMPFLICISLAQPSYSVKELFLSPGRGRAVHRNFNTAK
jgi:hypothetical protein